MSFGEVRLKPGVNIDWTPTLNEAGISASQLIRFRDSLTQKMGGWAKYYPLSIAGVPRDLHAWQDINSNQHLSVGTTSQFGVITNNTLTTITPQTLTSNFTPNFSTINTESTVVVTDPNVSNVTTFDFVFFNTPVSIGGIILSGLYPITEITGTHSYQITAATAATSTVNNAGAVPEFTTINGGSVVKVTFTANGMETGDNISFSIPTSGNGVTISGTYPATSIVDSNDFDIQVSAQATASGSFFMNSGEAQLVYYIALGPAAGGAGYGLGGYGTGGYGTGTVPSSQTGTPITATDWTADNWGSLSVATPANGGVYYWDPNGGFTNMSLATAAPIFNSGMFVSTSEQILVTYGSTVTETIGVQQDPMLVQWSDSGNFIGTTAWVPSETNFAGNFRIPIGSQIMAGAAGASNQNLIWTDLDLWAMNFIGQPLVFGFTQIGAGAGACGRHAVQKFRGAIYWMGASNFYVYDGSGVRVLPCPVWDAVFQNINTSFLQNVRAMPNTPFNEIGWFYPSAASTGENDSYVKMNVTEGGQPWDYGTLPRSAWIDQSVLGSPIASTPTGLVYQHETTNNADGQPLVWSYSTGYFVISPGEQRSMVDQFIPDFIWETFSGSSSSAQVQITFNVVDFPGQSPRAYGPYTVGVATKYVWTRFTGRQVSITISGSDLNSFSRLGLMRYRYRQVGIGGTFS